MDSFRKAIQEREDAWRVKAKEEALKIWQPAMDQATEDFIRELAELTTRHSDKLGIIGQALLKGSGDEVLVRDLVLDEMEGAVARAVTHFEEYLEQSRNTLGSDRELISLNHIAAQGQNGLIEPGTPVNKAEAEAHQQSSGFTPLAPGYPQASLTRTTKSRSLPSASRGGPGALKSRRNSIKTPTKLKPADIRLAAIRERDIASAMREFSQGGDTLKAVAKKWNVPLSTLWARLKSIDKSPDSRWQDRSSGTLDGSEIPDDIESPKTPTRRRHDPTHERNIRSALEDVRRGISQVAAAEKWGVSKWTIRKHVNRGKAPTTPKSESSKTPKGSKTPTSTKAPRAPRSAGASIPDPIIKSESFMQTEKGRISWKAVDSRDYIVSKYDRLWIVRCEKANETGIRAAVHYFSMDPFQTFGESSAWRHLQAPSKHQRHKCHEDDALRMYSDFEILLKHGYEVIPPHSTETEDGREQNRKWVGEKNGSVEKLTWRCC
ncbi:hypothetical protein QBC34DRAFT_386147 [Podospora aff. communis PSN243]|uniref:HTH psq-type domain-containing protein n=1 Tax=Podospora aff. communis PSN243 TaxID=3040156 RepID=A0AAV9G623_9PEZI|nr:hypothetical protein QBC34DRAFT_386147 [Podospora aff. communis PSN243]